MARVRDAADEADICSHTVTIDIGTCFVAQVVAAEYCVGYEFRFYGMTFFPSRSSRAVRFIRQEVRCVFEHIDAVFPIFRNDFGVRVEAAFVFFRYREDNRVGILLFNDGCMVDEACRRDGV